jgi:carbamoyltransferase
MRPVSPSTREDQMNILGISGLHRSVSYKKRKLPHLLPRHYRIVQGLDSAAALVTSDGVQAAAAEERFTYEKGTGEFPARAIQFCLRSAGLSPSSIDYVAHGFSYDFLRPVYERSDSEYTREQFAQVYSPEAQLQCLEEHFPDYNWSDRFVPVPHHLAHAASAFYLSGFDEALILVADGMGECDSTTIALGRGSDIEIVRQIPALNSLGIFYGVFTMYLGFDFGMDEYKIMGLAPYGDHGRYFDQVMDLIHLQSDGTYTTPILYQNDTLQEKETYEGTLRLIAEKLGPPRRPDEEMTQRHMDIAAAVQAALEVALLHVLKHHQAATGQSKLCMAGGVALNCTANSLIWRSRMFDDIFVQPAAADDGSALGAALYVQHTREPSRRATRMQLPLWGPKYDNDEIGHALRQRPECEHTFFGQFDELVGDVAARLEAGQVVGWFQGAMEFGPRALGSRSILADPRHPEMRDLINRLVKKREAFRPFAPAVIAERAPEYFEIGPDDVKLFSHMLFVAPVRLAERARLPAVTHVDGSARVQTVAREENPRFWQLLHAFGERSGVPMLLNTSFNVRGQPIVCTPEEAIDTFLRAQLDALAIGNYVVVCAGRR